MKMAWGGQPDQLEGRVSAQVAFKVLEEKTSCLGGGMPRRD